MLNNKPLKLINKICLLLFLAAMFYIPHLSNLGQFTTADEAKWLMRSGNFYYALVTRNFAQTYQREHPGVTIMWAGAAAYFFGFPDYVRFGPSYFTRPQHLQDYIEEHEQEPIKILRMARGFMVLACGVAFLLAWWSMFSVVGWFPATLGFLLIAFDPFFTGLSRLLHLDALSSILMVLSMSAWLAFSARYRKPIYLILSGIAGGLSWLTKSPSFFLIPMIGLFQLGMFWKIWQETRIINVKTILQVASPVLAWLIIGSVIFMAFFPALWVYPLTTIQQIFGQATSYAVEGHESATYFMGEIYNHEIPVWYFYPVNILWRTTPIVLIGLFLAAIAAVFSRRLEHPTYWRNAILVFAVFASLFLLFMSVGAKKFDRYIVPVFLSLDILAGLGWAILLRAFDKRIRTLIAADRWRLMPSLILSIMIVGIQATGTLRAAPYYLTYYNPLLGGQTRAVQELMIGWGEGIDQAARYLNTLPGAHKMNVAAWYGEGCFSYYFEGNMQEIGLDTQAADLTQADYAVIYIHQWQRNLPNQELLDIFARATPEYVVQIGKLDYVQVYNLHISPLLADPS